MTITKDMALEEVEKELGNIEDEEHKVVEKLIPRSNLGWMKEAIARDDLGTIIISKRGIKAYDKLVRPEECI